MAAGTTTYRAGAAAAIHAALAPAGFTFADPEHVELVVLDTFDGRLANAGLRLVACRRTDVAHDGFDLTLARRAGADAGAHTHAGTLPRSADDVPAGPLRGRLAALAGARVLLPLLTVTAAHSRGSRRNADEKLIAAVDVHGGVAVTTGPGAGVEAAAVPGAFAAVTELAGYAGAAASAREALAAADLDRLAGAVTMLDVAAATAGVDLAGTAITPGVPLEVDEPAIGAFRVVLANLHDAIVANLDGTVTDVDSEFLHDVRVAVRRTRAVLANAKRVIPAAVLAPARDEFGRLGRLTGTARDLDVHQLEWANYVAGMAPAAIADLEPVREHLDIERVVAHDLLAVELRGDRTRRLLEWWSGWLEGPPDTTDLPPAAARPIGRYISKRISRAHDTMIERGRAIGPATPAEQLHALRKDAKRLRYLIECFGGLAKPAARRGFVTKLKALQENLGEHQDAEVHAATLRAVATELDHGASSAPPATTLAIGQLVERMEQRGRRSREEFAGRFADFDSSATRKALAALLAGVRR